MHRVITLLLSLLSFTFALNAQEILKAYGNSEKNIFYHSKYFESHKAYFVLGSENDSTPTITKIDVNGNVVWSKKYSGKYHSFELGEISVPNRANTDIILTLSDFGTYTDLYIMRINAENGQVVWNKRVKYASQNRFSNFVITKDNHIIAATTVRSGGGVFFTKLDIDGNVLWTKLLNKGTGFQKTSNFVPDNNNGFIFGFSNGISGIIVMNFEGNIEYIYKTNNYSHIRSITKHPQNGYLISSYPDWNNRAINNELIYIDNNYNIVWKKIINAQNTVSGACDGCTEPYSIVNNEGEIIHVRENASSGEIRYNFTKFAANGTHISSVYGNNNDLKYISSGYGFNNQLFSLGSTNRNGLCLNNNNNGLFTIYTDNNNVCDTKSFTPNISNSSTTLTSENKNIITVTTPAYVETIINTLASDNVLTARNLCSTQSDKVYLGPDISSCTESSYVLNAGTGFKNYLWSNGQTTSSIEVTNSGTYWVRVTDECDVVSSDTVKVNLFSGDALTQSIELCPGQTYTINGKTYSTAGNYRDTLKTSEGCDSIVVTTITIKTNTIVNNPQTICQGQSIIVGSKTYTTAGIYRDTLKTTLGCDSIVITTITMQSNYTINNSQTICQGQSIKVGSKTYTTSGTYTDTLKTVFGCDSIIITNLTVHPRYSQDQSITICQGDSIQVGFKYYKSSGTFRDTLSSINGCDSIIVTNLTVRPVYNTTPTFNICQGDSVIIGAQTFKTAGVFNIALKTIHGCDSNITATIHVFETTLKEIDSTICQGEEVLIGHQSFNTSGSYEIKYTSIYGCDSIIYLNLNVLRKDSLQQSFTLCDGDSVVIDGQAYYTSNKFHTIYPYSNGCDSLVLFTEIVVDEFLNLSIGEDTIVCEDEVIILHSNYPDIKHNWSTGDTSKAIEVWEAGSYSLSISNACGDYQVTKEIEKEKCDCDIYLPNAFSPNGDRLHDTFRPITECVPDKFYLQIFDRWGHLVFETNDIQKAWNGLSMNKTSIITDTYVWYMSYEFDQINGRKIREKKGHVTVIP